jgi:hypothetical protein
MAPSRTVILFSPYLIPGTLLAAGLLLFIRSSMIPEYSVPNGHDLLFNNSWQTRELKSNNPAQLMQEWQVLRERIETRHIIYQDISCSMAGLGLPLLVLLLVKRVCTFDDLRRLETPQTPLRFHLLAALTWLSFIPAQLLYLSYIDAREDPPFVDNMAIPIESELTVVFGVIGLPVILLGVWIAIRNRSLPIPVWTRNRGEGDGLVTVAIYIALLLAMLIAAACVIDEPPLVPSCVFTVYLLLSGRAASVSPKIVSPEVGFEVVCDRKP